MLLIKKNKTARWVLTLNELSDCNMVIGNWLFVMKQEQLLEQVGKTIKVFLEDISVTKTYNEFIVTDGIDFNLPDGDLDYWVYQMPDKTDDDESRGNFVERGKLRVIKNITEYIHNTENKAYVND